MNKNDNFKEIKAKEISHAIDVIDNIQKAISMIADKISPVFSGNNLERLTEIAKDVSSGNLSAESIGNAYGNSKRIKDIAKKDEGELYDCQ